MNAQHWVAVDWGTSSWRGYLYSAGGECVAKRESDLGTLASVGRFGGVLHAQLQGWPVPAFVLMCGTIGSAQGWVDAGYLATPAALDLLALEACQVADANLPYDVWIVPGISHCAGTAQADVMRGEESQAYGLLQSSPTRPLWMCAPGTHSKWVQFDDAGRVAGVHTFMTGEVFGVLMAHSILGRIEGVTQEKPDLSNPALETAFLDGLMAERLPATDSSPHGLLHQLFGARAQALTGFRNAQHVGAYLSGLLIGHEVRGMAAVVPAQEVVSLIANDRLAARYRVAMDYYHLQFVSADTDCAAIGLAAWVRALSRSDSGADTTSHPLIQAIRRLEEHHV